MDTRQLVRGSTLYLPVQLDGALFSCGDAHGCQGDGEVCVTGLEAPMYASLRFTLEKGRSIPAPQYRTPAPLTPRVDGAPFYGTTGVGPDLFVGAQDAVRAMVDHIADTYGLGREDAYVLRSLCVDLKISEIVDAGQYIVSALLPEAVFMSVRRLPWSAGRVWPLRHFSSSLSIDLSLAFLISGSGSATVIENAIAAVDLGAPGRLLDLRDGPAERAAEALPGQAE